MNTLSNELLIVLLLLLANGIFAMAEMAMMAARKSRLRELAEEGDPRAQQAVAMAAEPARFLSSTQAGITFIAVLVGALGGDRLAARLEGWLANYSILDPFAGAVSLGLVVVGITLASVMLGELLPKRLALQSPERVAISLVRVVSAVAWLVAPAVKALTFLTDVVLRPFGVKPAPTEAPVSDEEVNILVEQGLSAGVFNSSERDMVAGVLELDQLPVTAIMTPRPRMVFLNLADPDEVNWRKVVTSGHSHFPVFDGNREVVLGMVSVKAIWANQAFNLPTALRNLLTPPLVVPETLKASQLLEHFKKTGKHIALVADEFGSIQGITTLIDVMEAIVGDLPDPGENSPAEVRRREDGALVVDASLDTDEVKNLLGLDVLPHEEEAEFHTLAGFVLTHLGRIPVPGDQFDHEGWRFEVGEMDRHRVARVLISRLEPAADGGQAVV
jgi:putative hemolysin